MGKHTYFKNEKESYDYSWILDLRKKTSPDQAYKNTYKGLAFLKNAGCLIDQAIDQAVDQDKDWKSET